jgi:hypothetical protein
MPPFYLKIAYARIRLLLTCGRMVFFALWAKKTIKEFKNPSEPSFQIF